ncbi:MAG: CRISPR-associated endonuclease Cas2 [Synergistaceae bacterium]|nr:CRISPR-associated endonuclease Cas2 [Synergistaceae bacterium]
MFVIMVYDVNSRRVAKVLKTSRRYLQRVQNSVFEGEITQGRLTALKNELGAIINESEDSILFYVWSKKHYQDRTCLGLNSEVINDLGII